MLSAIYIPAEVQTTTTTTEKISVKVRNEFDKPIKIMLGESANLTYIEPGKTAVVGNRKAGKFDFSLYDEDGKFVTKVRRELALNKKGEAKTFIRFNKFNVPNSGPLEGKNWSTGKKVAVGAGALGAAALGTALIAKARGGGDESYNGAYPSADPVGQQAYPSADPVAVGQQAAQQAAQQAIPTEAQQAVSAAQQIHAGNYPGGAIAAVPSGATGNTIAGENLVADGANAFASGGSPIKFLNSKYDQVTLIVEGTDGKPIGSNWVIAKATGFQTAKPLMFNGQKITIDEGQKVRLVVPGGYELTRYAFELEKDPIDGSYSWLVK